MKKKMLALLLGVAVVFALSACGGNSSESAEQEENEISPCFDILSVGNKTEAEVTAVLGDPITTEASSFSEGAVQNTYQDSTEILFVDDAAVRITVYPPDGSLIEDGAALIGLSEEQSKTPSYDNSENYYWNDNTEFYKIVAFNNGDGTISYIYVITDEAYQ